MNISIIIPTHLPLKKTQHLIESCVQQLLLNDELIIVVDSPQYAQEYLSLKNIAKVLVNKKNIGAPRSRNRGIRVASKDLIVLLDSDSIINDMFLNSHRVAHQNHPNTIIAGKTKFKDNGRWFSKLVMGCDFFENGYGLKLKNTDGSLYFAPTSNLSAPTHIFRKFSFNVSFPKKGGGEDNYWCLSVRTKYKIFDLANPIHQEVWPSFMGTILRVIRWGAAESLVVEKCLSFKNMSIYVTNCVNETLENDLNFRSKSYFSRMVPRLHRLSFVLSALLRGKIELIKCHINHAGY